MHVPEDILHLIVEDLRPPYPLSPQLTNLTAVEIQKYLKGLQAIRHLALTCKDFYASVIPSLYKETVIYLPKAPKPTSLDALFDRVGIHILTLIVDGRPALYQTSRPIVGLAGTVQALGRGLIKCSQLRRLRALGDHRLFPCRDWIKQPGKTLLELTDLVYSYRTKNGRGLSLSLVALGARLERLTIDTQCEDTLQAKTHGKLHLPSAFPILRHLHLNGDLSNTEQLKKLFSRIYTTGAIKSNADGTIMKKSPLRKLVITGNVFQIQEALPHKIGFQLTHLHYLPTGLVCESSFYIANNRTKNRDMHSTLGILMKACPNLIELYMPCSDICSTMECIPGQLRYLTLYLATFRSPIKIFEQLVETTQPSPDAAPIAVKHRLRMLTIVSRGANEPWLAGLLHRLPNNRVEADVKLPYLHLDTCPSNLRVTYLQSKIDEE